MSHRIQDLDKGVLSQAELDKFRVEFSKMLENAEPRVPILIGDDQLSWTFEIDGLESAGAEKFDPYAPAAPKSPYAVVPGVYQEANYAGAASDGLPNEMDRDLVAADLLAGPAFAEQLRMGLKSEAVVRQAFDIADLWRAEAVKRRGK